MDRMDVLSARETSGKSYFTRCGVAFKAKQGDGWNVLLDVMPAPQDGQFKLLLREPRQQDDQRPKQRQQVSFDGDFDADSPF